MQLSDEFALASLQLVGMELTAKMLSNDNVEVNATMKDIALCDQQKHRQQKRTGYVTVASPVGGGGGDDRALPTAKIESSAGTWTPI